MVLGFIMSKEHDRLRTELTFNYNIKLQTFWVFWHNNNLTPVLPDFNMCQFWNNVLQFFFQPIFTESLIGHFLTVLMQVLMHKSHDLLKEEIILAAFHMANVDFGTVHVLTKLFLLWHYWLLKRLLHKNQHGTQRILLNFENWTIGESQ